MKQQVQVSVIICSHNSRLDYLERVLDGLRAQTLAAKDWELVLVDNASRTPLNGRISLAALPAARVIRNPAPEIEAGLVDARSLGIRNTSGSLIVFVDDDNVLAPDYLVQALAISSGHPQVGAWGGSIRLVYEVPELRPPVELEGLLCCREVTESISSTDRNHHDSTPWGAGLCVRRVVAEEHLALLAAEPDRRQLDPVGNQMRFGGDTDLVYTGLKLGYSKGVFVTLALSHLIPPRRCEIGFLRRALEANAYSAGLHGWIETGRIEPPRTDWRYFVGELLRAPRRNRWQRLILRERRRGQWRAFHEFKDKKPRRLFNDQPLNLTTL